MPLRASPKSAGKLLLVAGVCGSWACGSPASAGDEQSAVNQGGCAPVASAMNPHGIVQLVDTLNAMPKPVELPCFVRRLSGPLAIDATSSDLSLQPAVGRRSPRIFIWLDPLIVSIAPDGVGRDLLELGERRGETRSLKGEVAFPVTAELEHASPFEHVMFNAEVTSCAFCHGSERPAPDIAFATAFESDSFRPRPSTRVGLDELRAEFAACDAGAEPGRCALLAAVFERESVTVRELPETFAILQ